MDINRLIHDGAATLHRGSVDRGTQTNPGSPSQATPPRPTGPKAAADSEESPSKGTGTNDVSSTSAPNEPKQSPKNIPTGPADKPVTKRASRRRPPPVYAQVWQGKNNKINDDSLVDTRPDIEWLTIARRGKPSLVKSEPTPDPAAPSSKRFKLGPGGCESLTGLGPSVMGKMPISEIAYCVSNWVYNKLGEIKDPVARKHVELEVKFGKIIDPFTRTRLAQPLFSEVVLDPVEFRKKNYTFSSEIDAGTFKRLESFLDAQAKEEEGINRVHILQRDESFKVPGKRNSRVSTSDSGELLEAVTKQRIDNLHIYAPNYPTDLRVSISIEHPADAKEARERGEVVQVRNKNRLSYIADGAKVDLTAVNTEKDGNIASSTKEAEVEAQGEKLMQYYEEHISNKTAPLHLDKFLEVIQYTLNTTLYLHRKSLPEH